MTRRRQDQADYQRLYSSVLERDGWRCQLCGTRINLHLHHQVFRSQGGSDSQENLITLCAECHHTLHDDKCL